MKWNERNIKHLLTRNIYAMAYVENGNMQKLYTI